MGFNDVALIIVWVIGLVGAILSAVNARNRIRAQAQLLLDQASFDGATTVIEILTARLETVENQMKAMRAREGKLFKRIRVLEYTLVANGIMVPIEPIIDSEGTE